MHAPREKRRSGFDAWMQMVSHFDPRTCAFISVAYSPVTHPQSQSGLTSARLKTLKSARNIMQMCEQEVAQVCNEIRREDG